MHMIWGVVVEGESDFFPFSFFFNIHLFVFDGKNNAEV